MAKTPGAKKDSFFITKKHNKPEGTLKRKFASKPHRLQNSKSSTTTTSGNFFIKPIETVQAQKSIERASTSSNQKFFQKSHISDNSNKSSTSSADGSSTKQTKRSDTKPEKSTKKPFDKKKWRLQKYSKKYKLQQWEEKRKKTMLHEYYKQVENEPKFDVQKVYEKYGDEENDNENNLNQLDLSQTTNKIDESNSGVTQSISNVTIYSKPGSKRKGRKNPHDEFEKLQEEKRQKREKIKKQTEEKAEALKIYKQNKLEKFKKLNKKTKKGQPIMKYRMEMLLEQIQKSSK